MAIQQKLTQQYLLLGLGDLTETYITMKIKDLSKRRLNLTSFFFYLKYLGLDADENENVSKK